MTEAAVSFAGNLTEDHLEEIRDETGYSVPAGVADEIASLVERLR